MKGLCLGKGVLTSGRIQDEDFLVSRPVNPGSNDLVDLGQFLHQRVLVVQSAGGVGNQQPRTPRRRAGDGIEYHRAGVRTRLLRNHGQPQRAAQELQLLDGSRPECVSRGQQDLFPARQVG